MKIKLVNGDIYSVTRAEITNGRLEIDFKDKTAEEVQNIVSDAANMQTVKLLTDAGEEFGELPGWTIYGGVCLVGDVKTAILTKETDTTQERIVNAESNALAARTTAESADTAAGTANVLATENATQVTDLQLAICELYEGLGV